MSNSQWTTKWVSAGCIVTPSLESGEVYLIKPANNWGPWALPKGRLDPGETREHAAIRETREETGLRVEIIPSTYLGTFEGACSVTHYYLARRVGGKPTPNNEVCSINRMSFSQALTLLKSAGNFRDWKALARAWNRYKTL